MPNPLARGISINPRTRCFVREKPKDVARLDAQRASSTKQLALGLCVPITDFEGVQEEAEVPLPANGAQPNRGPPPGHPIINGPMDETVEPVAEGGREKRARGSSQALQGGQRPPSRVVEQGLPALQAGARGSRQEIRSERQRASQNQQGRVGEQRPPSRVVEQGIPREQENSGRSRDGAPGQRSRASRNQEGQRLQSRITEQGLPNQQGRSRHSCKEEASQRSRASQREHPPSEVSEQGLPHEQVHSRPSRNEAPSHSSRHSSQSQHAPIAQPLDGLRSPHISQQASQAAPLRHSSGSVNHARSHPSSLREMTVNPAHNTVEERQSRSNAGSQRSRHSARNPPPSPHQSQQQEQQASPVPHRVQQLQDEESRSLRRSHASRDSGHSARSSIHEFGERVPARGSQHGRSEQSASRTSARRDAHQSGLQVRPDAEDFDARVAPLRILRR